MKTITDIKAQVKNPKRCNIYLDGAFALGLDLETVVKNRLKVGLEIDEERLSSLQAESELSTALDKALSFISLSKKTEKQVRDYLSGKGYAPLTADKVIEKMKGYAFIDDYDYALSYAKSYSAKKGKRLIALELIRKGVSEEVASKATESITSEDETARAIAEKYLKNKPKDKPTIYKCYKYLLGKGFSYEVAKSAVDKLNEDY